MRYDYFEYQIIAFNLFNTSSSFYNYINIILAKKLDIFIIVYLDNIHNQIEDFCKPHINTIYQVLK